jgi:hypothetical protein
LAQRFTGKLADLRHEGSGKSATRTTSSFPNASWQSNSLNEKLTITGIHAAVRSFERIVLKTGDQIVTTKLYFSAAMLAAAASFSTGAQAESRFVTGTGSPLTASANLDFTVTIPKFVYVRIGTGADRANNTTVDNLVFTVPAANVGDGTSIASTGGEPGGQVTARVTGNNGTIAFSSTTAGALNNGAGDTISWSQMAVAVTANTSATALAHPTLVDGASTSINLTPTSGTKVTNLDARWTFSYLNQNIVPAGTYGGVNAQNGRVTYAVSMP